MVKTARLFPGLGLALLLLGCGSQGGSTTTDSVVQDVSTDQVASDGTLEVWEDRLTELPDGFQGDETELTTDLWVPDVRDVVDVLDVADLMVPDVQDGLDGKIDDGLDLEDTEELDTSSGDALLDGEAELLPVVCVVGEPCEDGNPCTVDDECIDEICVGTPYVCDDGRSCTMDTCDGLGNCAFSLMVGRCLINGLCLKSGDQREGNPCVVCRPTIDAWSWTVDEHAACDDGDACTTNDECVDGECQGEELICVDGNPCTQDICSPVFGCTHPPADIPCEDGDICTAGDFCEGGECISGSIVPCEDHNPCTQDYCLPDSGCFHTNLNGVSCDDGDACTLGDSCFGGICMGGGQELLCDDWNDCTSDICDPDVGCTFPLSGNPCCVLDVNVCADDDPCTIDTCNPATGACIRLNNDGPCSDGNACTEGDICVSGVCTGEVADCDDGSPCTNDFCLPAVGCSHEPINAACDDGSVCTLNDWCTNGICKGTAVNCNDYNICTDDVCDPVSGCVHSYNTVNCNDLNLCTTGDHCSSGACVGVPKSCNDGNACTTDSCNPNAGCQNVFNQIACEDGNDCTVGDACSGGVCVPGELVCLSCNYSFSDSVGRAHIMAISTTAAAGTALDLDGNGTYDNSMSGLAGLANGPLGDALAEGSVHLLLEHHGLKTNGGLYTLAGFVGAIAAGYESCDFTTSYCGYTVDPSGMDLEACESMITFNNASISGGVMTAGGKAYTFPFQIPLSDGPMLSVTLYSATIRATVTIQGGMITYMNGLIGGAIPKSSFVEAINALPDDALPLPKSMILQMVDALIVNDIDTDGNGSADAASIAIRFEAIPAGILGIEE